jgi:hypothetical protein
VAAENRDVALDVALAEYEFAREQRRLSYEGSAARFNYFLLIASGGTAAVAGLVGTQQVSDTARTVAAMTIGGVVLLLGFVIFVRLVNYRLVAIEYAYTINALRTYLLTRAPQLRPYSLLPTLDDADAVPYGFPRYRGLRSWTGLAQTVGLVNSVLAGLAVGVLTRSADAAGWAAIVSGAGLAIACSLAHRAYERRLIGDIDGRMRSEVRRRMDPAILE